jgi:SNF2 family DNA or RNA helicase
LEVTEELILTVSEHRQFGWKLSLHSVNRQSGGSLSILGMPNIKEEIQKGTSGDVIALMRAVSEVSDAALIKAYSKEKDKTKIPLSTIENLIRPRIEKNCSKILALVEKTNTPLFFREYAGDKIIFAHQQIELLPESSLCLFNFIKDETGFRYFITLTNGEEEISLQQKPAIVLSHEPCIVLLGNQIHRVENIDSKKLQPFFIKTHIDVPASSEKVYMQKFVLKTIPKYEVRIEGIEMNEKFPRRQAVLVLEEDFYSRLTFTLLFQYDNQRFIPTANQRKRRVVKLEETDGMESICWFNRDLEWESQLLEKLLHLGLTKERENQFYRQRNSETEGKYGLIDWLNQNIHELKEFLIEQKTQQIYYPGSIRLQSKLDVKIDWFDLEIEVIFDHFIIPFSRFRRHILTGNPEYVLPDSSIFILPKEWFQQYHELFIHAEDTEKGIRLKKIHFGLLNDSMDSFFSEKQKKDLERFNQTPVKCNLPSEKLEQILRPYQKEGFYWLEHLRQMNFGGCLADDMGLGKTIQTITLLESVYSASVPAGADLREKGRHAGLPLQLSLFDEPKISAIPASLVVAPTSLLHNWQNELRKFAPNLKIYIYAGNKRLKTKEINKIFDHYNVIITSYGMVRSDIDYLTDYPFHYLILDESQYIKNPDSIIYKAINQLSPSHKLVITGTPIENSLLDLWAQFNFINPGLLGNLSFFKDYYVSKIKEKDEKTEASLLKIIQPFMLRRTKEEVTPELPPLSQEIVYCDMTEEQEEIYNAEKNAIRNKLLENKDLFVKNNIIALQSLTRLRLLSNHPAMAYPKYEGDSGKFDQIILYFESIQASGHKVLIFSSFVKHLKLLAKTFDEREWKYAMLTGQTVHREEEINKFTKNKDVNCFFISLKTGGTGLNLTEADYVFIIDPWWNPAAEMQALSRAHRIGQQKNVMVYRFISNDSVEEKILYLQSEKNRLSETFISSNNPLDQLKREEIENLFVD